MTGIWLPSGHHYDLHIERVASQDDAGNFSGGGNKILWHTCEAPWFTVDSMRDVLIGKRARPHFVIGGRPRVKHPVAIQLCSLDQAGRSLANDSADGYATNQADCFQVEVCWSAALAGQLTAWHYKALANLTRLINVAVPDSREVPPVLARRFKDDRRMTDREFVAARGHLGHKHAPDNDHTDPGSAFKGSVLMRLLETMPRGGWDL